MSWQMMVRTAHTWVGLIFGALVCLTCLSGSVAVFRPELQAAFSPRVGSSDARADLDTAVADVLSSNPGARLTRVLLPTTGRNTFVLTVESGETGSRRIVLDAGSGAVAGELKVRWLDWIIDFHHNLLAGRTGRYAVGGVGMLLFFLSVTSFLLWLTRKPSWKSFVSVRRQGSTLRFYYELHRAAGLWSCGVLALLSFTGIGLAYPDAFRSVFGQRTVAENHTSPQKHQTKPLRDYLDIAHKAVPSAELTELRLPKSPKGPISVRFRTASDLGDGGRNELSLDSRGNVLSIYRLADEPTGVRFQAAFTPVHYGEVGGILIKLLWSLTGITPTVLFVSGLLFWLRKRDRQAQPSKAHEDSLDEIPMTSQSL